MALNHESNLISPSREMWYENKGTEENPRLGYKAMPDIAPGANAMEVNQAYETFEQRMADLVGIGMARKDHEGAEHSLPNTREASPGALRYCKICRQGVCHIYKWEPKGRHRQSMD